MTPGLFFPLPGPGAKPQSPRSYWTYTNEDYVGRIAKVAKSLVFATQAPRIGPKVVKKIARALHLRFIRSSKKW